jgi:hypothetical protein
MFERFTVALMQTVQGETDSEAMSWQIESVKDCIARTAGSAILLPCLTPAFFHRVVAMMEFLFQDLEERHQGREQEKQDGDFDEEAASKHERSYQNDGEILAQLSHLSHMLFIVAKLQYFPSFQRLLPLMARGLTQVQIKREWVYVTCLLVRSA